MPRLEGSRERCHVTQPRAGINVSCSRVGQKGATGGRGNLKIRTAKASEGQRRTGTGTWTGQSGTGGEGGRGTCTVAFAMSYNVSPRMSWVPKPGRSSHEPIPRLSVFWDHLSPGPLGRSIPCLF